MTDDDSEVQLPPLPADLEPGFERVRPDPLLRELVSVVAKDESVTASGDVPGYVGVRPATNGAIAGYVNKSFIDLRLTPERASELALKTGWKLLASNSYTGTLRVPAAVLGEAAVMAHVAELFREALAKSYAGPPFEGGRESVAQYQAQPEICPRHWTEMLGGVCDLCD